MNKFEKELKNKNLSQLFSCSLSLIGRHRTTTRTDSSFPLLAVERGYKRNIEIKTKKQQLFLPLATTKKSSFPFSVLS
jgi:hypothetical protein